MVAFAAYVGSIPSGFPYDDRSVVLGSPVVMGEVPLAQAFVRDWWGQSGPGSIGSYRPVPVVSLSVDWRLSGFFSEARDRRGWPMHFVNVLLHALTMILAYRVFRRLTSEGIALGAALLCAVMAAPSEVVQSLVGRADLLESIGLLVGLWAHRRTGARWGVVAAGGLLLALGSKETGLMALVAWPALDFLLPDPEQPWRKRLGRYGGYAAVLVLYFAGRYAAVGSLTLPRTPNDFYNPLRAAGVGGRVFGAGHVFLERYVLGLIDPRRRLYDCSAQACQASGPGDPLAWVGLLLFASLVVLPLVLRRRAPVVAAGVAWFVIFFAPVSNFFVPATLSYGERLLYVPLFGLALAFIDVASRLRTVGWAALAVVGIVNAASLQFRHGDWRNDATLAASGLRYGADSVVVQQNNVSAALERGDFTAAERFGRRAVELVPSDAYAHKVLAVALMRENRIDEADAEFRAAIGAERRTDIVIDYANFLAMQRRYQAALELIRAQPRGGPQAGWLRDMEGKLVRAMEREK